MNVLNRASIANLPESGLNGRVPGILDLYGTPGRVDIIVYAAAGLLSKSPPASQ